MAQIAKFKIRGYRSFKKTQTLKFATFSKNGNACGLTYLVGENNSGKTTILEALRIHDIDNPTHNSFNEYEAKNNLLFQLHDSKKRILRKVTLLHPNSYIAKLSKNNLPENSFSFIPSRRYWEPVFDAYQSSFENARQNALRNLTLRYKSENGQFLQVAHILHSMATDPDQTSYNEAIALVRRIFPGFKSFSVINAGRLQIMYEARGVKHRSDMLGDGVVSVLAVVAFLIKKNDTVLVIDEPELSLHPLAQKRLAKVLQERSYTQQIILSTHSPYFIDAESFRKGAILNRVVKVSDKESEIHHTNNWSTYAKLLDDQGYQKPRVFDIVVKEIFFQDNILFVEGQDDRSLLDSVNAFSEDVNIFGYGVGGKDYFKLALKLASDIGIQKAAVLIDGGEEEGKVVNELNSLGFENYAVFQWNKHDIRDKDKTKAKPAFTDGYFSKNGILKESRDDFDTKIEEINNYFAT